MTGFRRQAGMVSKWWMRRVRRFCRESPPQSKIYAESNQSNFPQIFGGLISMQTLAIYRPLLVRGLLARDQAQSKRDGLGSRDVFSAPDGVLARAGARAVAKREDT
jgi:hypothetical protein